MWVQGAPCSNLWVQGTHLPVPIWLKLILPHSKPPVTQRQINVLTQVEKLTIVTFVTYCYG